MWPAWCSGGSHGSPYGRRLLSWPGVPGQGLPRCRSPRSSTWRATRTAGDGLLFVSKKQRRSRSFGDWRENGLKMVATRLRAAPVGFLIVRLFHTT